MQRAIEGPPGIWSSAKEASAWLGITISEFRREVSEYPSLLPHQQFGKSHKYFWMDLVVYSWLRSRARRPEENQKQNRA